jgi:hypothetical protein
VLALANFYFDEKRDADGIKTLQRLIRSGQSPVQQAAAHFRIAQTLSQRDTEAAVAAVRAALTLQPDSREYHLLAGDLEIGAAVLARRSPPMSAHSR